MPCMSAEANRAKFVQQFIESNKPTESVLSEMETAKKAQENADAAEILKRKKEMEERADDLINHQAQACPQSKQ